MPRCPNGCHGILCATGQSLVAPQGKGSHPLPLGKEISPTVGPLDTVARLGLPQNREPPCQIRWGWSGEDTRCAQVGLRVGCSKSAKLSSSLQHLIRDRDGLLALSDTGRGKQCALHQGGEGSSIGQFPCSESKQECDSSQDYLRRNRSS